MRIGVDVGGTNTDAVLVDDMRVVASSKRPTTRDVSEGVAQAIRDILSDDPHRGKSIAAVMIGTTHFTNALVERDRLDRVGVMRLASPSGEALPPMTGWPQDLRARLEHKIHLLRGGYEVDGREIAPLDEEGVRRAARECREARIDAIAISSAFAPLNAAMEERAAELVHDEHPDATVSLSHMIGRLGLVERENGTILNAALTTLAGQVVASFQRAMQDLGITAPLYISQNDGTLISAHQAKRYPVLAIGSGPTNSMRGAAFLTGLRDAIVLDVGGTTCDIGVLANGFPRESSISVDIGEVRTNFRMPDVLAIGLGGGTRIHLDPARYVGELPAGALKIGPDSVGYRITEESYLFGGKTLTVSDVAVALGKAEFGDRSLLPDVSRPTLEAIWQEIQEMLADGVDRMKTASGPVPIIAVGGGHFLIGQDLKGAGEIVGPPFAGVANAVGAAIAQVGAQIDRIVDYDRKSRDATLAEMKAHLATQVTASGGKRDSMEIVDIDETFLSYLPGRSAQVRMRAVADLELTVAKPAPEAVMESRSAH